MLRLSAAEIVPIQASPHDNDFYSESGGGPLRHRITERGEPTDRTDLGRSRPQKCPSQPPHDGQYLLQVTFGFRSAALHQIATGSKSAEDGRNLREPLSAVAP